MSSINVSSIAKDAYNESCCLELAWLFKRCMIKSHDHLIWCILHHLMWKSAIYFKQATIQQVAWKSINRDI